MKTFIEPKYSSFDVITSWKEDEERWAKQLAVHIIDKMQEAKKLPWSIDRQTVGEEFYVIVCSPSFLKHPNSEVTNRDLERAMVMEEFSESEVAKQLMQKIDKVGKVTLEDFEREFEKYFDMGDWYSS